MNKEEPKTSTCTCRCNTENANNENANSAAVSEEQVEAANDLINPDSESMESRG